MCGSAIGSACPVVLRCIIGRSRPDTVPAANRRAVTRRDREESSAAVRRPF